MEEPVKEGIVQEPVQTPQVEQSTQEPVKDRTTEQFEKLKESNQELKQERDKYKNLLDSLRPEVVPEPAKQYEEPINQAPKSFGTLEQADIEKTFESMKDEDGYLDGNKLVEALKAMDARARQADQRAQRAEEHVQRVIVAKEEEKKTATMRAVHEKFPQLDPTSEAFDPTFYDVVRNELIGQLMEGKEDPMAAAEKWSSKLYKKEQPVTKEEIEKKETIEEQKKQINAVRPRSASNVGYYKDEEEESLKEKIRSGKKGALAELLRRRNL